MHLQLVTPVAIMTSDAKGNHARITALMEALDWFGRGREAFRLFRYDSGFSLAGSASDVACSETKNPVAAGNLWCLS